MKGFQDNEFIETDWLKRWDLYSPHKVAIQDGETGRKFTYSEFYHRALAAAVFLKKEFNIQKGDRVAVLSTNELEHLFLFYGLQRLGAVLVPINFRLTERELDHIFSDSRPSLVLFQTEFSDVVNKFSAKYDFKTLSFVGVGNGKTFSGCIETIVKNTTKSDLLTQSEFVASFEEDLMILYTSGTTGSPKGAVLTHKSVYWNSINTSMSLNLTSDECAVIFLPFFHTGGWNVLTTPIIHRGGRLIFIKKFDAAMILNLSAQERATLLFAVPTTMDMMAQRSEFKSINLNSIRYAIVGGEPMPLDLIQTWHDKGIPVRQGYGLTEFGPNVFSLPQADSMRKIGSIGFPNFYIDVDVRDENDRSCADHEVGELVLRGPMCMRGYWKNEKATNETIQNGWLRTGDLVKRDEEGDYFVVGRKKDMFISGAENVYPVEIEQVLRLNPAVKECAVIGVPDEKWGEVGKAFIVLENNIEDAESVLRDWCIQNLAKYKVPKYFQFLSELPKGDSGKILKRNLPK